MYVRETLYKENEYMAGGVGVKSNMYEDSSNEQHMYGSANHNIHSKTPLLFDYRSPQTIKNI